jgi:hypothetical protein
MPLAMIVVSLTLLNLERAVFDVMAGIKSRGTSADDAFTVVFVLGLISYLLSPALLALYIVSIIVRRVRPQPKPSETD